jgi:hypothetical protein
MTRISMMLVGVVAVATAIAFALTMPRHGSTAMNPDATPAAPVKKADLLPPPSPPPAKVADKPEDPIDPAIEAADLQDGEGS